MSVDLIKHTINGVVPTELPAEPITMEHIENLYIIYRDYSRRPKILNR